MAIRGNRIRYNGKEHLTNYADSVGLVWSDRNPGEITWRLWIDEIDLARAQGIREELAAMFVDRILKGPVVIVGESGQVKATIEPKDGYGNVWMTREATVHEYPYYEGKGSKRRPCHPHEVAVNFRSKAKRTRKATA